MTWSIERLEEGYGIVMTNGKDSRTVFMAAKAGDAALLLAMAEVYELVKGGAAVEAFDSLLKPTRRRRK